MRRSMRSWSTGLIVIGLVPLALAGTPSGASISAHATCHAPRMIGLTVTGARARARTAGCQLRFVGAAVHMPKIQTIHTQSAHPGQVAKVVTVSVNPLCPGSINLGPPPGEPIVKAGSTELITGLFIEGGAFLYRSAPVCKDLMGKSTSGTITITNSVGSVIANNMALTAGQLLYVNVQPGIYTITGKLSGGSALGPINVNVAAGEIVRQDLVEDVP